MCPMFACVRDENLHVHSLNILRFVLAAVLVAPGHDLLVGVITCAMRVYACVGINVCKLYCVKRMHCTH